MVPPLHIKTLRRVLVMHKDLDMVVVVYIMYVCIIMNNTQI